MLGPSSPTQRNFSLEESSGSDAESEVGLETDRFGFLLTNGSTAGSVGPPPELVRQREAKWINIIGQWERILLKKTNKVKVQCQKGIPASLRAKCWPLLCGATDRMKQNENLYKILDAQPALQNWVDIIERDLDRQFPFHEMFLSKDGHGQRGLFRVLKAYTQYQPEEGYCQAQGPVAAVLLMNMPAEETFWCLVQISEQYLPGYYSPLLEGILFDAAMVTWVLKKTCPAAHKHLQHHGVEPLMFATDWLMCLFTRHLPFNTLLRVWDLFFCYGVRVLLQVAVVLVRRVLGRAEQRKQCQGQMETLERLRGVREQVQDEDDAFIAEVCSVPLSAKDLERQTEKALERWRKDKPSSTFDPRGRCQGYRMAWARARHIEEERDRKERQKGNLSVPLARSASTLSLSPSLLHKKWRKGGKVNAGDWAGGGRVVRHLSMSAKEDWGSWTGLHFKKVQDVEEEEDVISEEHTKQSELQSTGQTEQKELLEETKKTDKIPNIHVEETENVPVKPQIEQMEKKESQQRETEERTLLCAELVNSAEKDTTVETEETQSLDETQLVENSSQSAEPTPEHAEELDSDIQSQVLHQETEGKEAEKVNSAEEDTTLETERTQILEGAQFVENIAQNPEQGEELYFDIQTQVLHQETEGKDTEEETEKQVEEREHTVAVEGSQAEVQKETDTNTEVELPVELQVIQAGVKLGEESKTENVEETQVDTAKEVKVEAELVSEDKSDAEVQTVENPAQTLETGTQQQDTETGTSSQGGASEVKYNSSESLPEIDMREEAHTQTETETDVLAQTQEKVTQDQLEAEQHNTLPQPETNTTDDTIILPPPECIHDKEGSDEETEAEIPDETEILTSDAQSSEKESKTTGYEDTQNKEEISVTAHTEAQVDNNTCISDQTQVEEMPIETIEETTNVAASPDGETSTQPVLNFTAEPDEATSSVQTTAVGQPAPDQPKSQVTMGPVEEEKGADFQEDTGEECVFISTPDSNPQVQKQDGSHPGKHQTEPSERGTARDSRCSSSSHHAGDICVRKSSSSHGSRLARRLSEDLFTSPQKTNQSIPSQPDRVGITESESNPLNPTTLAPDVPLGKEVLDEIAARQEQDAPDPPKRFGLFRRLRGEQPPKNKAKGTTKMQVPKILIQDFSDGTGKQVDAEEEGEQKLSSRERRRRRRERERREKEEERMRKKREKELEKERERERRKPQTRGKSFQQKGKDGADAPQPADTGSQTIRYSAPYAESYF